MIYCLDIKYLACNGGFIFETTSIGDFLSMIKIIFEDKQHYDIIESFNLYVKEKKEYEN